MHERSCSRDLVEKRCIICDKLPEPLCQSRTESLACLCIQTGFDVVRDAYHWLCHDDALAKKTSLLEGVGTDSGKHAANGICRFTHLLQISLVQQCLQGDAFHPAGNGIWLYVAHTFRISIDDLR